MPYAAPTGAKDILPEEWPFWRHIEQNIQRITALYGFEPLGVPIFESTALFTRGVGEGSDLVVQKEMYSFQDKSGDELTLRPGGRALVPCGCAIALPHGHEAQVRPRSGLAAKHGVTVLNSPGTVDADYRGEVKVILANLGDEDFAIARGDRIAQLVVAPVTHAAMIEVDALDDTDRGAGGFGSTGV